MELNDYSDGVGGFMNLSEKQVQQFDAEGWVFLPNLFTQEEVGVLKGELPTIFSMRREEVLREKD